MRYIVKCKVKNGKVESFVVLGNTYHKIGNRCCEHKNE